MKHSDLKQKLVIVYAVAAVSVVVLLTLGIVIISGTNEDEDAPAVTREAGNDADSGGDSGAPPPLRTVIVKRAEGANATIAAATPSMQRPTEIWLRVSAAPKQQVTGSWNVSCGSGNVAMDTFTVTPPQLMKLKVPGKDVESCIAGATAQLKVAGRVKLSLLRDR